MGLSDSIECEEKNRECKIECNQDDSTCKDESRWQNSLLLWIQCMKSIDRARFVSHCNVLVYSLCLQSTLVMLTYLLRNEAFK